MAIAQLIYKYFKAKKIENVYLRQSAISCVNRTTWTKFYSVNQQGRSLN